MAAKPSPGASDRPPSILSEHGEGYCAVCRFVVGLDATGMLDFHSRGRYAEYAQPASGCKGGGKRRPIAEGQRRREPEDCGRPVRGPRAA